MPDASPDEERMRRWLRRIFQHTSDRTPDEKLAFCFFEKDPDVIALVTKVTDGRYSPSTGGFLIATIKAWTRDELGARTKWLQAVRRTFDIPEPKPADVIKGASGDGDQ